MENIALSRRNFIKLLGAGSLTTLTGIGLTGCAITNDIQYINKTQLDYYDIVICDYPQKKRCIITYTSKYDGRIQFLLYQPGDTLKYLDYRSKSAFDEEFHPIERINLQDAMMEEHSYNVYYTAAEISAVATKIEEEYNKTREEEGNSYTKSL